MLIVYKNLLSFFKVLKAGILNIPGNKQMKNGVINDNAKFINKSFIINIWVLWYTAQKHDKKYQKNRRNNKLIIKYKLFFIIIHFIIF